MSPFSVAFLPGAFYEGVFTRPAQSGKEEPGGMLPPSFAGRESRFPSLAPGAGATWEGWL